MAVKKDFETTVKTAEHVAADVAPAVVDVVTQGFDQTVAVLKDGMTGAVAGIEKTQTEMKANMDKAVKSAEDIVSFSQGNVEAVVKSGQIWAAGMQEFTKSFASLAQAQMDQTVSVWKAMSGVKSLKDAMDLQSNLARSTVEAAMNETGKLTDASMKLAEQTLAPITARVTLAVEKFGRAA
jgi:phasin family protein